MMTVALRFLLVLVPLLVSVDRSEGVRCFGSFDTNSGECDAEIGDVEEEDCCQNPHYGYQAEDGSCQFCGRPTWSPWSSWSFCNVLCGDGVRQRTRICFGSSDCKNPKDKIQTEPCNGTCCEERGWSEWGSWAHCSISCGGQGVRRRLRVCSGPPECHSLCTGSSEETETCEANNRCPVHGSWSSWSDWSQCSGTCINDQQGDVKIPSRVRRRSCSNPTPSVDTVPHGNSCPGDASQSQDCSELPNCPVNGNWGAWSAPEPCSVSCGEGLQLSFRKCDNPEPKYGGKICEGSSTQSSVCGSPCPVHGFWSGWSNWGECSSSCIPEDQPSTRTRRRSCSNPAPSPNPRGNACQGEELQRENCDHLPHCPVDGNWGSWSRHSPCSVTCGVGLQESVRTCDSPAPKHGGRPCLGENKNTIICSTKLHCPVHGVWSEWSEWSECRYPFGQKVIRCTTIGGKQKRERQCDRAHNGSYCEGENQSEHRVCYDVNNCKNIKGTWESWGEWTYCVPPCGAGSKRRRFLFCNPDYSQYRKTIGRQGEEATFFGRSTADCGELPEGISKWYEIQDCLNVPSCT